MTSEERIEAIQLAKVRYKVALSTPQYPQNKLLSFEDMPKLFSLIDELLRELAEARARAAAAEAERDQLLGEKECPDIPACPIHEAMLMERRLPTPLDQCIVCTRNERDELRAELERERGDTRRAFRLGYETGRRDGVGVEQDCGDFKEFPLADDEAIDAAMGVAEAQRGGE